VFCWIQGIVMHPLRGVERQEQMVVLTTIHDKQMWDTVGIRMALGASTADVLRLIFREGLLLAAAGIAIGMALALIATRLIASFLYGVSPFDLAIFIGVPVLLGLVSLLACWLPARRATLIDPIAALRSE
jgi:ABC-type antimicrobial peptide transport system permease subunit